MSAGAGFTAIMAGADLLGGLLDRSALRAQARVHEENARLSLLEGEEVVARTLRDEAQVSGAAIAAMAGSGARVGTGTAVDIIEQNAIEREVEVNNVRAQAQGRARNFRQAAEDARYSGDMALIGGVMSAAGRVASFAAQTEAQNKVDAQIEAERAARLEMLKVDRGGGGQSLQQDPRGQTGARWMIPEAGGPMALPRTRRFGVLTGPGG